MYFTESYQDQIPSTIFCDIKTLSSALKLKGDYVVKYHTMSSPGCMDIYILYKHLQFYA